MSYFLSLMFAVDDDDIDRANTTSYVNQIDFRPENSAFTFFYYNIKRMACILFFLTFLRLKKDKTICH